jgi:hypothetical protein
VNHPRLNDFDEELLRIITPLAASPGRKRMMQEELRSHLWDSYQEELSRLGDEQMAADAARQRQGRGEELRAQLQSCVPFLERVLFADFGRKENFMSRWIWMIVTGAVVVGLAVIFPRYGPFIFVGATGILSGLVLVRFCQKDKALPSWLGPRPIWMVGCVGALFGTTMILPALAKLKQHGAIVPELVVALGLGAVIVLEGMAFIFCGIRGRRAPVA